MTNLKANFNFVRKYLTAPNYSNVVNLLKDETTTSTLYQLVQASVIKIMTEEIKKNGVIEDKQKFLDHLLYVAECGVKDGIEESIK